MFLASRKCPGILGPNFDRCCNFMYSLTGVAIHTVSNEVNTTKLANMFPKATAQLGRKSSTRSPDRPGSTMRYDPDRN